MAFLRERGGKIMRIALRAASGGVGVQDDEGDFQDCRKSAPAGRPLRGVLIAFPRDRDIPIRLLFA